MNKQKSFFVLILVVLSLFLSLQLTAYAAETLDSDMDCTLSIHYKYGSTAIANSNFEIYKVADRVDYSTFQMIAPFSDYPVRINNQEQEEWDEAALALSSYVIRDKLIPTRVGITDKNGELFFDVLKPGLYLIIPSKCVQEKNVYTASPFFVALPGLNFDNNVWEQITNVKPKCIRNTIEDPCITKRVVKIWDDKGYETLRPTEIVVKLLRDGDVYDTVNLNQDNRWSFSWFNLNASHEWMVVEKENSSYAVSMNQQDNTFLISNKYVVPEGEEKLVISKKIEGDCPVSKSTFTFILSGKDISCPMPDGSNGLTKELNIHGAGNMEVDGFYFSKPGTYTYTISEKNNGVAGYTYDLSTYTITYLVTQKDGKLFVSKNIRDSRGNSASVIEFVNMYKAPDNKLPQTGLLWWPVPILISVGVALCVIGALHRKR